MTIPTSGQFGIDRIKFELAMDGLNSGLAANDLNNEWFRLLANRPGGTIDFGAFRGRGCRFDGQANVYDPIGVPGSAWQFDPRLPYFNATLVSVSMLYLPMAHRYQAIIEMSGDPGTRKPIFVKNATTSISYSFQYDGNGNHYRLNGVEPSFMRYGGSDLFVIAPDLR